MFGGDDGGVNLRLHFRFESITSICTNEFIDFSTGTGKTCDMCDISHYILHIQPYPHHFYPFVLDKRSQNVSARSVLCHMFSVTADASVFFLFLLLP